MLAGVVGPPLPFLAAKQSDRRQSLSGSSGGSGGGGGRQQRQQQHLATWEWRRLRPGTLERGRQLSSSGGGGRPGGGGGNGSRYRQRSHEGRARI
jgi:hypothetical protein